MHKRECHGKREAREAQDVLVEHHDVGGQDDP